MPCTKLFLYSKEITRQQNINYTMMFARLVFVNEFHGRKHFALFTDNIWTRFTASLNPYGSV